MAEITSKDLSELQRELIEKQVQLRDFRFGGAGSRVKNVKAGRNLRREIARIMTEITRRNSELKKPENVAKAEK